MQSKLLMASQPTQQDVFDEDVKNLVKLRSEKPSTKVYESIVKSRRKVEQISLLLNRILKLPDSALARLPNLLPEISGATFC